MELKQRRKTKTWNFECNFFVIHYYDYDHHLQAKMTLRETNNVCLGLWSLLLHMEKHLKAEPVEQVDLHEMWVKL